MIPERPAPDAGSRELAAWRTALGHSTRLWAHQGHHEVSENRWTAMSGAAHVDYNVLAVLGGDVAGHVSCCLEEVRAARVPAVVMLAGAGLAGAQILAEEGWVCVGTTPFMIARSPGGKDDDAVRRLESAEFGDARALIADAFDLPPEVARIALPDAAADAPGIAIWGLFERHALVSCLATVQEGDLRAGWSMATPVALRRRGLGHRLFSAVLARAAADGVATSIHYASAAGLSVQRSVGFEVVEHWQLWSRPRWVLGRA